MKPIQRSLSRLRAAAVVLALAGSTALSLAQSTNYIVDQMDADTASKFGNQGWGTAYPSIAWDELNQTTTLGPNTPGSGSLKWSVDWSGTASGDQIMVVRLFDSGTVLNLNNYTNISFDIRFDPSSTTDGKGSYGAVEVDWVPQSDGWPSTSAGATAFPSTNNNWVHVAVAVDASANSKLSAVRGMGFKIQQNATGAALTGVTTFWIDNIILGVRTATLPPPKMAVAPVTTPPGLMVVASGGGNEYKRGMIRTLDPVMGAPYYSWVGMGSTPVTYSVTIASYPNAAHAPFQSQIFLVPNGGNDSSIDYNAASCLALDIRNLADGTAAAVLRYKTNHTYANASDYKPATLVCSNGVLGTWSLTFVNDTNVTVTAPDGGKTNIFLPDQDTAWVFGNPLSVYFGNQQNGAGNIGQACTFSRVKISGAYSSDIDDTFSRQDLNPDPLNPIWRVVCDVPSDVFIVHPTDKYWVGWSLPDSGFSLQTSATLAPDSWTSPGLTNIVYTTLGNRVLVPESSLPAPGQGFFRMIK